MQGKLFGIILVLFVVIRLINLPSGMQFGSDEGRDFLAVWEMYTTGVPKLIGPPSEYSINGQQFYFGPAPYYVVFPALVVGNWDPVFVSYFLIALHAVILGVSLWLIGRRVKNTIVVSSFAVFCAFHPAVITYTRSYWNPYFTFSVSVLLLALLLQKKQAIQKPLFYYAGTGFLLGLGMQFHYAFVLAIVVVLVWLWLDRKLSGQTTIWLTGGFVTGVLPLVLYELANNFYNVRTFFLVLTNIQQSNGVFGLHPFYLISLLPFLFYLFSLAMGQLQKTLGFLLYVLFGLGIAWSLILVAQQQSSQLSYAALSELAAIIVNDQPTGKFNVVDQLTKDNRAMALRYLITVKGVRPLGVADYPQSDTLYLYTTAPLEAILADPAYELQSDSPLTVATIWRTAAGITLYKLKK